MGIFQHGDLDGSFSHACEQTSSEERQMIPTCRRVHHVISPYFSWSWERELSQQAEKYIDGKLTAVSTRASASKQLFLGTIECDIIHKRVWGGYWLHQNGRLQMQIAIQGVLVCSEAGIAGKLILSYFAKRQLLFSGREAPPRSC